MRTSSKRDFKFIAKRVWIVSFGIFFLIALFFLNHPFNIVKAFDALEINLYDPTHVVDREIVFTGQYNINIFAPDTFSGEITISGYEETSSGHKMVDLKITKKDRGSLIVYEERDNGTLVKAHIFGTIFSNRFLKKVVIIPSNSYSNIDATCIVANADNYDDAVYQATKYLK